jgi:hypothetical protein
VRAAPSSGSLWSEVVPAPEGPPLYPAREATYAIDPQTLRAVRRYPVGGSTAAISPDGATLATRPIEHGLTRVRVAIQAEMGRKPPSAFARVRLLSLSAAQHRISRHFDDGRNWFRTATSRV